MSEAIEKPTPLLEDADYQKALASLEKTLEGMKDCSPAEREQLQDDFRDLREMVEKTVAGRVDIVVFGEISTGKSALINALIGQDIAAVDVQGGWTKDIWKLDWDGCGYVVPGIDQSQVVLVDTPGLNEVNGAERGDMARDAAARADLVLFVTDSDLNDTEFAALVALIADYPDKPVLVVLNKNDLYSPKQRERLMETLNERLTSIGVPANRILQTSADPREVEYMIEDADGNTRSEWRQPKPDIEDLKIRILEVLEHEGLALIALNAAMYASDKTDRIASLRIVLRERRANQVIWSFAATKAVAVALNPFGYFDVAGGIMADAMMIVALSRIYGISLSWRRAWSLTASIGTTVGGILITEWAIHWTASAIKAGTFGWATPFTAIPQGAAAGFGSYVVGRTARYYFEHGASWGGAAPKAVVKQILAKIDKKSILAELKDEIRKKIDFNRHSTGDAKGRS